MSKKERIKSVELTEQIIKMEDKEERIKSVNELTEQIIFHYKLGIIKRWKTKKLLKELGFTKDDYIVQQIKEVDRNLRYIKKYEDRKINN